MKRTYEEETALIAELEALPYPVLLERPSNGQTPDNSAYWNHYNAISDAYWRRRRLSSQPGRRT